MLKLHSRYFILGGFLIYWGNRDSWITTPELWQVLASNNYKILVSLMEKKKKKKYKSAAVLHANEALPVLPPHFLFIFTSNEQICMNY